MKQNNFFTKTEGYEKNCEETDRYTGTKMTQNNQTSHLPKTRTHETMQPICNLI